MTTPCQPRGPRALTYALLALLSLVQPLWTAATKENKTSPMERLKRLTQAQGGGIDTTEEAAARDLLNEDGIFPWMTPAAADYDKEGGFELDQDATMGSLFASVMGDDSREDMEGLGAENAMIR